MAEHTIPTATIVEARLAEFDKAKLAAGHGTSPDMACAVDWSSYLAGAEWSDDGEAANMSSVIRSMLTRLNDRLNDEKRQILKPYIPRAFNTRDGRDAERRRLAAVWTVNTALPQWLELAGMVDRAAELRGMEVSEWTPALRDLLREVQSECGTARRAARDRLRDKILAELKKRKPTVADAAAAAAADAAAVADAVADAAANTAAATATVAVANAAAVAVADAVAAIAAAASAAADAAAAAVAVAVAVAAADAAAVAAAAADAAAVANRWDIYDRVYSAVKENATPIVQERLGPTVDPMLPSALELLDQMIAA